MNKFRCCLVLLLGFLVPVGSLFGASENAAPNSFRMDFGLANKTLQQALPDCEKLMDSGNVHDANAILLAAFPEATRTPAQSFLLGNVLYEIDRQQSYKLHQAAALAEPNNMAVIWEWAMEQHRAGEYSQALDAYKKVSKASPDQALPFALQADCLLHLNRIDEATEAWRESEAAPDGSVEGMEEMICAVKREPMPHQRRAELLALAIQKKDIQAASDLIALDCDFPRDWWNGGPYKTFLTHDLAALKAAFKLPPEDDFIRAISCAAECATADSDDKSAIKSSLARYNLLIDEQQTIPSHGGLLTIILNAAVEAKAIDDTILNQQLAPLILKQARNGKDTQMWNAALFAAPPGKPEKQSELEREGWQATGDARFAAGLLLLKDQGDKLTSSDPDLVAALKQFPDSGLVQHIAYNVAQREHKVTKLLLANAAKAEFKHFSSFATFATVVDRPRSDYLRGYFSELEKIK